MTTLLHLSLTLFIAALSIAVRAQPGIYRTAFTNGDLHLTIEILDDDLAHFQLSAALQDDPISTSPMVAKTDYPGPSELHLPAENVIRTVEMRLEIDAMALCVTITDTIRDPDLLLTTFCPPPADSETNGLAFTREGTTDLYGLGEQFQRRGGADGNWFGKRRPSLNRYGNALMPFEGGNVGTAQFPILYALGENTENYALFLDDLYAQYWTFIDDPFSFTTPNATVRWYVMTGPNLPDLRRDYMELTGTPPVPPKQMFGLWVSEYGYESWTELEGVLDSLRAAKFPLDGFVLDLQWFGGIGEDGGIGSLAWDETNFPDPADFIAKLREQHGVGIMTIEESYVLDSLPDYADLAAQNIMVRECDEAACEPVDMASWWGRGGMVDWTNADAAAFWHDQRRQHLIDEGVTGHWTDLGEPENFDPSAYYYGFPELGLYAHADVHNVYNLLWSKSIWDGYQRNGAAQRPFILSRSGTSGSQRYGVAMWSGDIAANMPSLTAHMNAQMHLSLSGVDYFGSDVGGFYRQAADPLFNADRMYTVWLANSVLLDVPLRPHASNLQNRYATAPSLIGDVQSNLANVRLRYELSPYLYTLAHRAYRNGAPLFAPLVYYLQDDPNVRALGSQKMIGTDLMMATLTGYSTSTIQVYLPAGGWFDHYTGEYFESSGEWIDAPVTVDGLTRAPLFVRDGAIIPQMRVDDDTLNMLGQRSDGSVSHDLGLSVYTHKAESGRFTLIEDDGQTMAYQDGAVSETTGRFTRHEDGWTVEIGAALGDYDGAPEVRDVEVRLLTPDGVRVQSGLLEKSLIFTFGQE